MCNKPAKTKINWLNESEMLKFKERRRFETWKDKAHFYFDKIWRDAKILTRKEAYEWLAKHLEISEEEAHFKSLNKHQCEEAIFFCQQLLNDNRRMDLDFGIDPITPFYII
jgi:hypothetical protein